MIRVNIITKNKAIAGFEMTGHAGYAEDGEDIVCAAVSVLAINTVNTLQKLLQVDIDLVEDQQNGGLLKVALTNEDLSDPEVQLILQSLVLGLSDIEQSYPKYMKTNISNQ